MYLKTIMGTSLMVQWLRLCAFTAWGQGIDPWLGNWDPGCCMAWPKKKNPQFWERVPGLRWTPKGSVMSDSLEPLGLYSPWNSPGQNTGVGSLSLLQGIFPTQVSRTAGRFFTSWATLEAPIGLHDSANVKDLCPSQWYWFSIWNVSGSFQSLLSTLLSQFRSALSSLPHGIASF